MTVTSLLFHIFAHPAFVLSDLIQQTLPWYSESVLLTQFAAPSGFVVLLHFPTEIAMPLCASPGLCGPLPAR